MKAKPGSGSVAVLSAWVLVLVWFLAFDLSLVRVVGVGAGNGVEVEGNAYGSSSLWGVVSSTPGSVCLSAAGGRGGDDGGTVAR